MADYCTLGQIIGIPNAGGDRQYVRIEARYCLADDAPACPNCGGLGWVWRGWFTCDGATDCFCIALVETGEAFVPLACRVYVDGQRKEKAATPGTGLERRWDI